MSRSSIQTHNLLIMSLPLKPLDMTSLPPKAAAFVKDSFCLNLQNYTLPMCGHFLVFLQRLS